MSRVTVKGFPCAAGTHPPTRAAAVRRRRRRRPEALQLCRRAARAALRKGPEPLEIICESEWHVQRYCTESNIDGADAVRIDYPDWWFCVWPCDTNPFIKLSLETCHPDGLQHRQRVLCDLLSSRRVG